MLRRATALKRICDRQRVQNAIFEKFGISVKKSRISSKKMIDHTIEVLNNDGIAIIRIDCFYEPLRIDSYQKYHAGHVIPIYGYDNTRNMFDILEGDFVDSVVYDAKKLEYEHVRNAYKGYIEEFKTHNHTYYEFKKVDNSVDYKKEYEVRKNNFTEYFQSNSDVFLESLKEINNYKQKLSNYFANGINDNISTIVTSFNRMLDEVVVQKYLFSKLFELPSEYSVVIDETIRLWKAIRAIVTKSMFKKSITDKSLEMLNEMFDKQYKNECERLQMLMSNIA